MFLFLTLIHYMQSMCSNLAAQNFELSPEQSREEILFERNWMCVGKKSDWMVEVLQVD